MARTLIINHSKTAKKDPPDVILGKHIYLNRKLYPELEIRKRYELDLFIESACGLLI